jgi:N-methylhydantoinase B/oxoprolinase/acetone carboxylase alpha subunit
MTVNSERRIYAPYGLRGGEDGVQGENRLVQNGQSRNIGGKFTTSVGPGDQVIIETPGGGGWGK